MSQQEQLLHPEQDEHSMSPTELLEKRLNRVNLAMSQLQGLSHNTFTNMQKDVVFALHVVAALKEFLPKKQVDAAVEQATAAVGAYDKQAEAPSVPATANGNRPTPVVHSGPVVASAPMSLHERAMPPELRQPHHRGINEAADAAKAALGAFGEQVKERLAHEPHPGQQPRSLVSAANKPTPVNRTPAGGPGSGPATSEDYLGHFIGSGSVFAKYFSPEVYRLGRGFAKPGYGGFGEYEQDALRVAPAQLREFDWPSGFYLDQETRLLQFYMGNAKLQVLVTNLPNEHIDVWVSFAPFTERTHVRNLNTQSMHLAYGVIEAIFNAAERFANSGQ